MLFPWCCMTKENFQAVYVCMPVVPCATWDLSSPARDQASTPWIGRQILKHWTTGESQQCIFK